MRRLVALVAIPMLALGAAVAVQPAGAAAHRFPATLKTVVRPVTSGGYARAGFTVVGEPTGGVSCGVANPSPAAVSRNIEWCFPTVEYAVACWKGHAGSNVLCMRNPRAQRLVRIPLLGPFAPTPLAPADERAPLSMVLGNGDYCKFRDGGTPAIRTDHPRWTPTYYCHSGKIVWQRVGAKHYGVNMFLDSWVVIVAGTSGPIVSRHVLRAWFVGTYTA